MIYVSSLQPDYVFTSMLMIIVTMMDVMKQIWREICYCENEGYTRCFCVGKVLILREAGFVLGYPIHLLCLGVIATWCSMAWVASFCSNSKIAIIAYVLLVKLLNCCIHQKKVGGAWLLCA
ncbi:hypothetical protein Peur_026474 [Populus x canadensis]